MAVEVEVEVEVDRLADKNTNRWAEHTSDKYALYGSAEDGIFRS